MENSNTEEEWTELHGNFKANNVLQLRNLNHIEKLSITKSPRLKPKLASTFTTLNSVEWLWLWCDISRTAMRYIVQIPNLKRLDVLQIVGCGKLPSFAKAKSLEDFRSFWMTEPDLLQVIECSNLRNLSAQFSELTNTVINALVQKLPKLESIDLEGTEFNDEMAELICSSQHLISLEIGNTKITTQGLVHLSQMAQLKSLDLWANTIKEKDLELLSSLPNLEYLSIGDYTDCFNLDADLIIKHLKNIPSLKRIWLDGVILTTDQKLLLESRYERVEIT